MSAPTEPQRPGVILPPWLVPGVAREPLRETFARARWALGSYWLFAASGYVVLLATALTQWHGDGGATIGMIVASALGVAFGNLLALLRVRPWPTMLALALAQVAACASLSTGAPPTLVILTFTFLWSAGCGHATLQRSFPLATLWIPIICWTAAIITILEKNGRLHTWQSGHKDGVWQPVTLAMLFLVVVEFFLFLAGQEHYHGQVWQSGAVSTPMTLKAHRDAGATRITRRGVFAVLVLAAVATAFTGKIAPYFWRTGRPDDGPRDPPPQGDPEPQRPREPGSRVDWDGLMRSIERAMRQAERQAREVLPFVPLFLLNRPLKRLYLLHHLRRPVVALTPTERATNLWRYVVIALGDVDAAPRTGEAVEHAVGRLVTLRNAQGQPLPEGLVESSELYQRVRFGLGIPTGAVEALQTSAERAFETVRAPMNVWQRVTCWWRKIEG